MAISITDFLTEWMVLFLKNKDLIFRRFKSITSNKNTITLVQHNGDVQVFHVKPFPQDLMKDLQEIKSNTSHSPIATSHPPPTTHHPQPSFGIVLANTRSNFDALLKNWDALVNLDKKLCIYFVNPFSSRAKQWAIHPATHQMITSGAGLKIGLTALFETVDETTEDELTKNIKARASSEPYPLHADKKEAA